MRGPPWTPAEDDAVRAAAGWREWRSVAECLGRTHAAVRKRAERLGVTTARAPRPPEPKAARLCRRCGEPAKPPRLHYCSDYCAALAQGHCPACGRKLAGGECPDTFCRSRADPALPGG
ncbi:SANT/Myb-like DNA-binding domain-containing protein [Candidatus Foliamicus sp.]